MKTKNAYISLLILTFITISVAGCEFFTAIKKFHSNGNVFDFCAGAVDYIPYFMMFFIVLFIALPFALLLYKSNNISIKNMIIDSNTLPGDIILGILLGCISAVIAYPFSLMRTFGASYEQTLSHDTSVWFYILYFLSLSLACGILKEIYFRGFAKHFLSDVFGENGAIIVTALLFGIVDWQNMGSSIILGLLWGYVYKKKNRLIIPIIAHSLLNGIGVIWMLIFG
ncbi:MAG: lysostaphin resistance A-like protein [Coprococcus sp.]